MRKTRRIAAYGVCRNQAGRVLLARGAPYCHLPGAWQIPGGGVEHGEHPAAAVVREFAEETGLRVAVAGLRGVVADVLRLPLRDLDEHTDRIIYDVRVTGGTLRDEPDGTTDAVAWVPEADLAALPLVPFTAEALGRPVDPEVLAIAARVPPPASPPPDPPARRETGRRFGAYGLVTDPDGRVLLALISDGYPGGGRWHLPGGGTDHGEQPAAAFLRELAEEADQVGRITALLDVGHRHNPAALGPEGRPLDWHVVRVIYRAVVDAPTPPRVTEAAGGSTARAGWFAPAEAAGLPLTELAASALRRLND
ncbi:MAG TPA: NUDIX domain-containing protein [Micromonosporaceae bacterium]|nr:NUDIX domain-containing protein [Micromonosporaceae bacterium]